MNIIFKYILYVAVIFILYLIIAGFYSGNITKNSTISEATEEVSDNTKRIIKDTYSDSKKDLDKNSNIPNN